MFWNSPNLISIQYIQGWYETEPCITAPNLRADVFPVFKTRTTKSETEKLKNHLNSKLCQLVNQFNRPGVKIFFVCKWETFALFQSVDVQHLTTLRHTYTIDNWMKVHQPSPAASLKLRHNCISQLTTYISIACQLKGIVRKCHCSHFIEEK